MGEGRHRARVCFMQALRAAIFFGIIISIHIAHAHRTFEQKESDSFSLDIEQVLEFFPNAISLETTASGIQIVKQTDDRVMGYVIQTSPISDDIVGYSGPTNSLLAFDTNDQMLGVRILESADTREHVKAIRASDQFRFTWNGLSREEVANLDKVDAVSGSTLTCIAIQQAIQKRLGGDPPNLKFPQEVALEEAQALFPRADYLRSYGLRLEILDSTNQQIGTLVRSSPYADQIVGYQGPTDVLMGFDQDNRLVGFLLRGSYDNEPYVGYVREDDYFRKSLNGKTLHELSELDFIEDQVEGVSGATMTSLGVADSLKATATTIIQHEQSTSESESKKSARWKPSPRDYGTILVLVIGLIMAFTRMRGVKPVRVCYQIGLIVYLGFLNGDMVSQAFLAGVAQHGVPWKSTFGLCVLSLAALMIPLTTRRQVYCHQLCPHGALQQLVKGKVCSPRTLPRPMDRILKLIPPGLLLVSMLTALMDWPINLASIEPFDAYLFQVAGVATIGVALTGTAISLVVPMAYCRYGCPTGAMLGFLRRHARSDRWTRRDSFALALFLIAVGILLSGA